MDLNSGSVAGVSPHFRGSQATRYLNIPMQPARARIPEGVLSVGILKRLAFLTSEVVIAGTTALVMAPAATASSAGSESQIASSHDTTVGWREQPPPPGPRERQRQQAQVSRTEALRRAQVAGAEALRQA